MHSEHDEEELLVPSKTQRKRAMEELQDLGEKLAALSVDQLKKISLPEDLDSALREVQRMPRLDEARRRQMQYVGKLMRSIDAAPIRAFLAELGGQSAKETAKLHRLELLREKVLENEQTLHELATRYPSADLQHLRALRRAALKEKSQNKPPRNFRALFQYLRTLEEERQED